MNGIMMGNEQMQCTARTHASSHVAHCKHAPGQYDLATMQAGRTELWVHEGCHLRAVGLGEANDCDYDQEHQLDQGDA